MSKRDGHAFVRQIEDRATSETTMAATHGSNCVMAMSTAMITVHGHGKQLAQRIRPTLQPLCDGCWCHGVEEVTPRYHAKGCLARKLGRRPWLGLAMPYGKARRQVGLVY